MKRRETERVRGRPTVRRAVATACLGLLALVLPLAASPGHAAPAPVAPAGERWPLAVEGGATELTGLIPIAEFDLTIPPGWQASGSGTLTLDYELPNLVESAVLGISLNGGFVDAVALPLGTGTAQIPLPADGFRTGANDIRIEATIDVLDDRECPDPWHPARVVTFGDASGIEVPVAPAGSLTLDQLPAALEPVGVVERTVTVRFIESPSAEDLTAAASVIAALRDDASLDIDIEVASLASGDRAAGPDIVIGVAADLAAAGFDIPAAPGGIVQIERNPSSNARLVISGSTPADVLAAARSVGTLPATPVQVGIETVDAPTAPAPRERFTLADLGYPDRELTGPGVESTLYGFDAALSVAPTSMTVIVDAVRSASAHEVSGLSVHVNGSRVGTVHFDVDTGATSGVQINVSGADVRPGRNFLRIDAEFQGPAYDCDQRPPNESVEISSSTSLELVTNEDSVAIDLEDLPYLLRAPNDSEDLVVVLPDGPTRQDLADAIDIAVTYGDDRYTAQIAHAGTLDSASIQGRHLILLGEPEAQPLHDLIPDSIVATHDDLTESGPTSSAGGSRLGGVIEVVPNPVDPTHAIMLATGFDAAGADLAQAVLLEPRLRGELYGRATFVGGSPENPLLAPVLEPVRIQRGELAADVERPVIDETSTSIDDDVDIASTIDDGTVLDEETPQDRSGLGSIPLGPAGLLGLGALIVGAGAMMYHRRRVRAVAATP